MHRPYLLHLLQSLRGSFGIGRVTPQLLQVQSILLQVTGDILTSHAVDIHQLQDGFGHSILDSLHSHMPVTTPKTAAGESSEYQRLFRQATRKLLT